jgi:hypothetical protein
MMLSKNSINYLVEVMLLLILGSIFSCDSEEDILTPYIGSPAMSNIIVEQGTFKPKITWSGGYVSVIGANSGGFARLNSSIIWLIKTNGNNITYPITFGEIPGGCQSLVADYEGTQLDELKEDLQYTYWVLKEDVWNSVSSHKEKILLPDSTLDAGNIKIDSDTIRISSKSFTLKSQAIDLYPNISDLLVFGRLGAINIVQAVDEKGPIISWKITQSGVTDTLISAIGLVEGQQYAAQYNLWDMWSIEETPQGNIYGKQNIITAPLFLGEQRPGTRTFTEFNPETFERDSYYYIWIANENWNGTSRTRTTNYYAYATFKTW